MTDAPVVGRRERKKAATRQAIADAALNLFLERGYDRVSVREVAEAADVSTTTLFKHFPSKESLVFDQGDAVEAALVAAVRERPAGQSIIDALHTHVRTRFLKMIKEPRLAEFRALIDSTPALRSYSERLWAGHADSLAAAIAEEYGVDHDDLACLTLARFVVEIPSLVRGRKHPQAAVAQVFDILTRGWQPPNRG
jgi:AcrR family transcriptional regulator